jgi:hypothetical protein
MDGLTLQESAWHQNDIGDMKRTKRAGILKRDTGCYQRSAYDTNRLMTDDSPPTVTIE